jgi:ribosomal protein S18 acetylase RimI-like enzyme
MILRPATKEDIPNIARIHLDTWLNAYRNILESAYLSKISYQKRIEQWTAILSQPNVNCLLDVAEEPESQEIVGFSYGRLSSENCLTGEVVALYIRPEYQRQGIGSLLLKNTFKHFIAAGRKTAILWVLDNNIAVEFYRKLGGRLIDRKIIVIGRQHINKTCFDWEMRLEGTR